MKGFGGRKARLRADAAARALSRCLQGEAARAVIRGFGDDLASGKPVREQVKSVVLIGCAHEVTLSLVCEVELSRRVWVS